MSAKVCSLLEMNDEWLGTDLWTHISTISERRRACISTVIITYEKLRELLTLSWWG